MKKSIINVLKIVVPLLLGLYIFWYFWSSFDEVQKDNFIKVFKEADYFWVFVALVIGFISHLSRAIRWKYALKPLGHQPSTFNSYNAIMVGYIANIVVPRMGEASRAGVLKATDNVPFDKGFGSIVAERVIDVICLGIITGTALLFNFEKVFELYEILKEPKKTAESEGGISTLMILGIIATVGLIAFVILLKVKPQIKDKLKEFVKGLKDGFLSILKMKDRVPYIVHTLIIWGCYVGMFWVVFFTTDFTKGLPASAIMIGFVAGTIGFIITQGGIGTYPIMVGSVVTFYRTPELLLESGATGQDVGFGMLVWASQTILIVVLGLVSLALVQKKKKKI